MILVNSSYSLAFNINYVPSTQMFEKLYGFMQAVCSEENVTITNVVEKTANYFVNYFLVTDA